MVTVRLSRTPHAMPRTYTHTHAHAGAHPGFAGFTPPPNVPAPEEIQARILELLPPHPANPQADPAADAVQVRARVGGVCAEGLQASNIGNRIRVRGIRRQQVQTRVEGCGRRAWGTGVGCV